MTLELIPRTSCRDRSGFGVFSQGDAGQAHVMAHRMLDEKRYELGHHRLSAWLRGRTGIGSDWTHLQWHMAVFELAVGDWDAARARFEMEILPAATEGDDALTDAPAMLWRLWLDAPRAVDLSWEPVRAAAARNLGKPLAPYVELHCLLALAGARDVEALDQWLRLRRHEPSPSAKLLARFAVGLHAFAAADYELAASILHTAAPRVAELGGSAAQNQLFTRIANQGQALPLQTKPFPAVTSHTAKTRMAA